MNTLGQRVFIDVDDQVKPQAGNQVVAKTRHFGKFPGGINMQQGERHIAGPKGFSGQVQHDGRVLADGIKHARFFKAGGHFPDDEDAFCFELF